jgi:hypothetical protein
MYIRVDADHGSENRMLCQRASTDAVADLRPAESARIAIVRAVRDAWTMAKHTPLNTVRRTPLTALYQRANPYNPPTTRNPLIYRFRKIARFVSLVIEITYEKVEIV